MTALPQLKLRTMVPFPSKVVAGNGIVIDKTDGTYTISSALTAKHITDFGITGVGNETTKFNLAVNWANAQGGYVALILPSYPIRVTAGAVEPFTQWGIYLVGEGPSHLSRIAYSGAGPVLQWGKQTDHVEYGGTFNVGFQGDNGGNNTSILCYNSARLEFDNVYLELVSRFCYLGDVTAGAAIDIHFRNVHGIVANFGDGLFNVVQLGGGSVDGYNLSCLSVGTNGGATAWAVAPATGRHLFKFAGPSGAFCDTFQARNGFTFGWDRILNIKATTGTGWQNIDLSSSKLDACNTVATLDSDAGGQIIAVQVSDNPFMACVLGHGIECKGAGVLDDIGVERNKAFLLGKSFFSMQAAHNDFVVKDNFINEANRQATGDAAIDIMTGCVDFAVTGNVMGGPGVAAYSPPKGLLLRGAMTRALIGPNHMNGTTAAQDLAPTAAHVDCVFIESPKSEYSLRKAIAAPGTPGAGNVIEWLDSTSLTRKSKNAAGDLFSMVQTTTPSANLFVAYIDANGLQQRAQPAFSGITGTAAPGQGGTGVANNAASTLTIAGSFATTFTITGATGVTLPTSGTLGTLAGAEELTNKTLNASVGKGVWTVSGTWTLPAHTLGGAVSGGGNQINNVIIGSVTPLAGAFTALTGTSIAISATGDFGTLSSSAAAFPGFILSASNAAAAPYFSFQSSYTTDIAGAQKGYFSYAPSATSSFVMGVAASTAMVSCRIDGSAVNMGAPVGLKSCTVGTVPSASPAGLLIYVSNETGGGTVAFSDGANWRRVQDRNVVS